MGRARTPVGARVVAGVGRAWCAGRRGAERRGHMGRAPDGGAPDREGARATRRMEGRRMERAHVSGMHAGGGVGRVWAAGEQAARSGRFLRARAARASARSGSFCECVAGVSLIRCGPGYLLTSNGLTAADGS
jgi:hypothetical protein